MTGHLAVAERVQLVIKGQFSAGWDVGEGEEADASLPIHHPLLGLQVGLAAVVDEPASREPRPLTDIPHSCSFTQYSNTHKRTYMCTRSVCTTCLAHLQLHAPPTWCCMPHPPGAACLAHLVLHVPPTWCCMPRPPGAACPAHLVLHAPPTWCSMPHPPGLVGLCCCVNVESFGQGQDVKGLSPFFMVSLQPLAAHTLVNHFTHILHHKRTSCDWLNCLQAPPPLARVEGNAWGIVCIAQPTVTALVTFMEK